MVRASALIALLALAGCDSEPRITTRDIAASAEDKSIDAGEKVAAMQVKIDDLENRVAAQEATSNASSVALDLVQTNHESLRKTVNENVKTDNDRNGAQNNEIAWLMDHAVTK